jgi:hypothetical protein
MIAEKCTIAQQSAFANSVLSLLLELQKGNRESISTIMQQFLKESFSERNTSGDAVLHKLPNSRSIITPILRKLQNESKVVLIAQGPTLDYVINGDVAKCKKEKATPEEPEIRYSSLRPDDKKFLDGTAFACTSNAFYFLPQYFIEYIGLTTKLRKKSTKPLFHLDYKERPTFYLHRDPTAVWGLEPITPENVHEIFTLKYDRTTKTIAGIIKTKGLKLLFRNYLIAILPGKPNVYNTIMQCIEQGTVFTNTMVYPEAQVFGTKELTKIAKDTQEDVHAFCTRVATSAEIIANQSERVGVNCNYALAEFTKMIRTMPQVVANTVSAVLDSIKQSLPSMETVLGVIIIILGLYFLWTKNYVMMNAVMIVGATFGFYECYQFYKNRNEEDTDSVDGVSDSHNESDVELFEEEPEYSGYRSATDEIAEAQAPDGTGIEVEQTQNIFRCLFEFLAKSVFGVNQDDMDVLKKQSTRLFSIGSGIRSIDAIFTFITKLITNIINLFKRYFCEDVSQTHATKIKNYGEKISQFEQRCCQNMLLNTDGKEIDKLYVDISNDALDEEITSKELNTYKFLQSRIKNVRDSVCTSMVGKQVRIEPYLAILVGDPGIGKSIAMTTITEQVSMRMGWGQRDAVWSWSPTQNYMSGYKCQPIVTIDEFGSCTEKNVFSKFIASLLPLVSTQAVLTEQASVENKGNVPFNSYLMLGTANKPIMDAEFINIANVNPEAIKRRIHYHKVVSLDGVLAFEIPGGYVPIERFSDWICNELERRQMKFNEITQPRNTNMDTFREKLRIYNLHDGTSGLRHFEVVEPEARQAFEPHHISRIIAKMRAFKVWSMENFERIRQIRRGEGWYKRFMDTLQALPTPRQYVENNKNIIIKMSILGTIAIAFTTFILFFKSHIEAQTMGDHHNITTRNRGKKARIRAHDGVVESEMYIQHARNFYAELILMKDDGEVPLRFLTLGSNLLLGSVHYKEYFEEEYDEKCCLMYGNLTYDMKLSELKMKSKGDLLVIKVPKYVTAFKDIRRHLLSIPQTERIAGKSITLLRHMPDKTEAHISYGYIRKMIEYYSSSDTKYIIDRAIWYNMSTSKGWCGSPIVHISQDGTYKIIGIHTAGCKSEIGYAQIITTEDYEYFNTLFDEPTSEAPDLEICMQTHRDFPRNVNSLGIANISCFVPTRSKLRIDPTFENKLTPTTTAPARLKVQHTADGDISPMYLNIAMYSAHNNSVDEELLEVCYESALAKYTLPSNDKHILNDYEVLNGMEGLSSVDLSTSPGYPYTLSKSGHGKHHLIETQGDVKVFREDFKIVFDETERKLRNNIIPCFVFIDMLKDERLPIAKVEANRTRLFQIAPLELNLLLRKYFGAFEAAIMESRSDFECQMGVNPYSNDWTVLARKLKEHPHIYAFDYTRYDKTIPLIFVYKAIDLINAWYDDEFSRIRMLLARATFNAYHLAGNVLFQLHKGNPSGNALTTIVNSIVNSLLIRYAYYNLVPDNYYFDDNVNLFVYGDDLVVSMSESVHPFFTIDKIASTIASIGMTIKLESSGFDNIMFLKRKFMYYNGRYWSPMHLPSVLEILTWYKGQYCLEIVAQTVDSVIRELANHRSSEAYEYSIKILKICTLHGIPAKMNYRLAVKEILNQ